MNFSKYFLFFLVLHFIHCVPTSIYIIVNNSNVEQQCGAGSQCATNSLFSLGSQALNTAGSIVTLPVEPKATINNMNNITKNMTTAILFEKKSKQIVIQYTPTVGELQGETISLLFQLIDLTDTAHITKLPKTMQADIKKYTTGKASVGYVVFMFKSLRKNIWTELAQTYVEKSSKDQTKIPLLIQPDGNIHITTPAIPNKQEEQDFYIRIDQI